MPKPPPPNQTAPSLHLDWKDWLPYIDRSDLTDDQKREMIETLWSIVMAFIDLGWDVTGAPKETSGQVIDLRAALTAAVLNSEEQEKEEV